MAAIHLPGGTFDPLDPARTVYVHGKFNSRMVGKVGMEIRCLQVASTQPITLFIDSPGGETKALDQIYQILQMKSGGKRWAFVTVAGNQAGSAAAILLALGDYSIADIALFAYTHVAHEGGFLLDDFPKIRAWIERVKAQQGFVLMG